MSCLKFGLKDLRRARTHLVALTLALAMVVVACGSPDMPTFGAPGEVSEQELEEICAFLAEGLPDEGMDQETYGQLVAEFWVLCGQIGVELPVGGGAAGGGRAGTGGDDAEGDARTDGDLVDADPLDEDVLRRAIEAGPQCDPAIDEDLEILKIPAIGPFGSPPFDAGLAKQQWRAAALCWPEPYSSQLLLIGTAFYEPLVDFLAVAAEASNQGSDGPVDFGQQAADLAAGMAAMQSDELQTAIASLEAFYDELNSTGAWDQYATTETGSPMSPWWEGAEMREFLSRAQDAGLYGGVELPAVPTVP